jgi:hypothetical protein
MRITLVGAILIVLAVLIGAILIDSFLNQAKPDPEQGTRP